MAMEKRNKGTRLLEDNFSKRMKENCDTTEQREKTWKVIFHSYLVWPFKHSRETERKKKFGDDFFHNNDIAQIRRDTLSPSGG
jgi:hypothetical protein